MNSTSTLLILSGLEGNQPTHLKGMQVWLAPHTDVLVDLWWCIFAITLVVVLWRVWQLYRRS